MASSNIFQAASLRGAQKTIAPVKSQDYELKPQISKGSRTRILVESDNQISALAKSVSARWSPDHLPDLICSLLTGSAKNGKAFRTIAQRNGFQAGMSQLILHLPGSVFVYDQSNPSDPVNLLENTLIGAAYYEEHIGFAVEKQWRDIPHENSIIRLQQPVQKKIKIGPYVGAYYDKVVILQASSAAESGRLRTELELAIWMQLFYKYSYRPEKRELDIKGSPVGSVVVMIQSNVDELGALMSYIDHNVAIVIVSGCGGVADMLARGLTLRHKVFGQARLDSLEIYARELFPQFREHSIVTVVKQILAILDYKDFAERAVVLDATDPANLNNLEKFIVDAIIKGSYGYAEEYIFHANLTLAIKCGQLDVTHQMMFSNPLWNDFEVSWAAFELAVGLQNRSGFVDAFIQDGFSMKNHLTPVKLARLFQYAFEDTTAFFWRSVWNEILAFGDISVLDDRFVTADLNPLIYRLTGISNYIDFAELTTVAYDFQPEIADADVDRKAMNALVVFAVLSDNPDLLLVTIKHSKDPIPTTLFAESMYRGLAYNIQDRSVMKVLHARADMLSATVYAMYEMAYQDNRRRARALLIRDLVDYNNHNALRLALNARDKKFLSHRWIQEFLTRWYYGFISVEGCFTTVKLLLSAIFVAPIYKWLSFPAMERTLYQRKKVTMRSVSQNSNNPNRIRELKDEVLLPAGLHPRPRTDEEKQAYLGLMSTSIRDKEVIGAVRTRPQKCQLPFRKRIYAVWNSPCVKFHTSQWIYYAFLILLCVDMMLPPCRYIGVDIAVFIYVVLRWIALITKNSYMYQNRFVFEPWKIASAVVIEGMFCILFFLFRIAPFRYESPWTGRVVLGFGVFYYCYRIWDMFYQVDGVIGPSIRLVVRSFTIDVTKWAMVTYPLFIASGLVWQIAVYPDAPATGDNWRKALYRAFGAIFGFADYTSLEYTATCASSKIDWSNVTQPLKNMSKAVPADRCWTGDYSDPACNTVTFWSYAFYLQYYLLVLIGSQYVLACAIYTRFIDEWADNNVIWKFYRCKLIMQYGVMSSLPPPFNILGYIWTVINFCINKGRKKGIRGLKNMIEMEKVQLADSSSGNTISPYWSSLALRYFLQEEHKKRKVIQQEKDDQECHDIEAGLANLLEFIEGKERELSA